MKAVILCGGTGSRLRPLTESHPKPLIKLMNVPVLEIIIGKLEAAGVRDIYLSLGFMAQEIIELCDNLQTDAELHLCEESKPLGTAGGVKNCISGSDEPLLVVSGDNIFDVDLKAAERYHKDRHGDFTVIGKTTDDPREYGCIVRASDGQIDSFIEKPNWENADSFLINTGMYIMEGNILSMIPERQFFDFAEDLFPLLFREKKTFLCFETDGFWGDIGEFEAYLALSGIVLDKYTDVFPMQGTLLLHDEQDENGNCFEAPCLIDSGTVLGKENKIGPFAVIGKNVSIGDKCSVEGAVIGSDCVIGDGSDIMRAVLDDNVRVGANCVIEKNAVVGYGADIGKFTRLLGGVKIWPGKTILPESVINKDMFYETPASPEFDIFGVSGKAFSQFTLSDAVRIGQAAASVKDTARIGVSCDGKEASAVYRELLCAGILSCGVSCYDFDESFMSQSYFYSAYCELDFFIYISTDDDIVNLSFYGKNGMPINARRARMINGNYRFSAFAYASPGHTGVLYRMSLLSTAYLCGLRRQLCSSARSVRVVGECENPAIKKTLDDLFGEYNRGDAENENAAIQFLVNPLGTDLYCMENEKFYSSERIRSVLCELEFAAGHDVLVPESASSKLEEIARKYGRNVLRVFEGDYTDKTIDRRMILDSLWNFDAVHLCAKVFSVLSAADTTLAELCSLQDDLTVRSRIIELKCGPSEIRDAISSVTNASRCPGSVYYDIPASKGAVKIRQLGNTNRIRMLVEAADMETAKEIMTDISGKFAYADIDNKAF